MKNTVGKGLFFYILIFLGVIVGVACIFMAILVLSPGTELFGISYYYQDEFKWNDSYIDTNNEEVTKKVDTINYLRTSDGITYFQKLIKENHKFKFVINTGYTRVHVLQDTSSTHIGMRISGRVTGISKSDSKKDSSVTANYTYDSANDCYEFVLSIVEPEIVLPFSKAITIDFFIPDSIDLSKVDFEINTKNGEVVFGHKIINTYHINSLSVNVEESSTVTVDKNIIINNGTSIVCPKGSITLDTERPDGSAIAGGKLFIKTDSAKVTIDKVKPSSFQLQSESSSIKIKKIESDFDYDAYKGVLIVTEQIDGSFSCSERVNISNIQIEEVTGDVLLPKANTSNITIGNIKKNCLIKTSSGKVKIKNMVGKADIQTESGNVEVNFNQESISNGFASQVITKSGDIKLNYSNIINDNIIETESGDISIAFKSNLVFTMIYDCKKNVPTATSGIPISGNSASIVIGSGDITNILQVKNEKGKTNFSDQYTLAA